jgi:hypothetical protein
MRTLHVLIIILSVSLTSCATTDVTSVWKDESYGNQIKKICVIGAAQKPGIRRIFEREFVNQLKALGVYAVPSHQYISDDKMMDKDIVISKIKELDIDAVIITRLLEKKRIVKQIPGYYTHMRHYYATSYKSSCPYGYNCKDVVVLETNLYEVKTWNI